VEGDSEIPEKVKGNRHDEKNRLTYEKAKARNYYSAVPNQGEKNKVRLQLCQAERRGFPEKIDIEDRKKKEESQDPGGTSGS